MNQPATIINASLASAMRQKSTAVAERTPFDLVAEKARAGELDDDQIFRLLGRLWVIKRMMYYVYGGWAQGLSVNEYPPSIDYLLSKQIYDDSTHEMLFMDEILRRGYARSQPKVFAHEYGTFMQASRCGHLIFTLRALANYAHNLRISALNLGAKVIELTWLERFGGAFEDPALSRLFGGLVAETESHIQMGRFVVERFVHSDVDIDLAQRLAEIVRRDYLAVLDEVAAFVLRVDSKQSNEIPEIPKGLD
ncbi:MAG: hypothetical protein JKY89_10800 [Immundisolibacteraceae bacterium]|nr:hypothetical protein [Immundisolibacteraceae bacterium]